MPAIEDAFDTSMNSIALLHSLAVEPCGSAEIDALRRPMNDVVPWEHVRRSSLPPLVAHAHAAVGHYYGGLQTDTNPFQSLSPNHAETAASTVFLAETSGLGPAIRLVLTLADFAKGGDDETRRRWTAAGVDLTIHNEAAASLLKTSDLRGQLDWPSPLFDLAVEMVANHGLAGQHVRGETPRRAFERWVEWLRLHGPTLGEALGIDEQQAVISACNAMHIVDICDTAAVRPGLVDDRLYAELVNIRDSWLAALGRPELLAEPRALEDRFRRLRHQAAERGEPPARLQAALASIPAAQRATFDVTMRLAQLWYFEPATHRLSADAAMKLLFLGVAQADHSEAVDTTRPFHVSFQHLVASLGLPSPEASYRVRLVEALLAECRYEDLSAGRFPSNLLASFFPHIGGDTAVGVGLSTTTEAEALVTLLAIYEDRSSVAFHQILKLLCDAYGLRKDEFDRLANEARYLETMNAARSDKERMLDFATPGTIVEIGPGGGVVLDLLEQRFPDSDIVGLDSSHAVVEELERRRELEGRRWRVVEGDAYELPQHFGAGSVDTVIFCSVLHEIYSYVAWDGRKFNFDAVASMLRAAWRCLRPGGRIVIRDGVKPADGVRQIRFLDPDGPDFLRRFQAEFEGRDVAVTWLDTTTARLLACDAMEFLYCYTWGPSSFPYEVRELYGIMQRDEYEETVLSWLAAEQGNAAAVDVRDLSSYLQPGYPTGLADKIVLMDENGRSVELPDSNAVWVFERR